MTSVFRVLFDIFVYYTLTGVYMQALCDRMPLALGLALLCVSLLLYGVCCVKGWLKKGRAVLFLLPLICILSKPSVAQLIQLLPAWLYGCIVLIRNLADMDYKSFHKWFGKSLLLLVCALIPLIFMAKPVFRLAANMAGYLMMVIATGVLCLRSLRDRSGGLWQLAVISLFTAACVILCWLGIPQKLLQLCRDHIILGIIAALARLFSFLTFTSPGEQENTGEQLNGELTKKTSIQSQGFEISGSYSMDEAVLTWLETFFYVILAIVLVWITVKLVVSLIKSLKENEKPKTQYAWKDEVIRVRHTDGGKESMHHRRPRDPKAAVRYYYWRYMQECAKRGIVIEKGWTAEQISKASCGRFSESDVSAMLELYSPIRYDDNAQVSPRQAKQAARLWQKLRRNGSE